MSNVSITQRLTRQLGTLWPNHEQQLVLQAIFAEPERAREAYLAWRGTLDIEQPFDDAVMRLLPLLYLRLLKIGLNDPLTGRLKGVYRRVWSDTHTLFHGTAPVLSVLRDAGIDTMLLKGAPLVLCNYRNYGCRPMSDVDIAVRFADVEAAVRTLSLAGWTSVTPISRDDLEFRHAVPFRGPGGHEVDLHWHVLFTNCSTQADEPFWHNRQPAIFRDIATSAPGPTLALLDASKHRNADPLDRRCSDPPARPAGGDRLAAVLPHCREARPKPPRPAGIDVFARMPWPENSRDRSPDAGESAALPSGNPGTRCDGSTRPLAPASSGRPLSVDRRGVHPRGRTADGHRCHGDDP